MHAVPSLLHACKRRMRGAGSLLRCCACRHGGVLSEEEQERAVRVAMALLRHLHVWAPSWQPAAPPDDAAEAAAAALQQPDAPSSAQAVLLLLSRLTKRHALALKVGACPLGWPSCGSTHLACALCLGAAQRAAWICYSSLRPEHPHPAVT